jgi:hypothetical protein
LDEFRKLKYLFIKKVGENGTYKDFLELVGCGGLLRDNQVVELRELRNSLVIPRPIWRN